METEIIGKLNKIAGGAERPGVKSIEHAMSHDPEHIAFVCRTCGHDFDLIVSSQTEIDACCEELGCIGHDIELASYEPAKTP